MADDRLADGDRSTGHHSAVAPIDNDSGRPAARDREVANAPKHGNMGCGRGIRDGQVDRAGVAHFSSTGADCLIDRIGDGDRRR